MIKELKRIFADSYVLIIFLLGGLIYPLIYGLVYHGATVDEMPVAVVDLSQSSDSRRFIQKLDATRELDIEQIIKPKREENGYSLKRRRHSLHREGKS